MTIFSASLRFLFLTLKVTTLLKWLGVAWLPYYWLTFRNGAESLSNFCQFHVSSMGKTIPDQNKIPTEWGRWVVAQCFAPKATSSFLHRSFLSCVFLEEEHSPKKVYQFIRNRALSGGRFKYNCNYIIICFTLTQEMQMILAVPHLFGLVACTSVTLETCKTLSSPWGEFPWANSKDCLGRSVFYLQN